jgi:hypothetical protein
MCINNNNNNNNNRPDVTVVDKTNKKAVFIDIAIPLAQNLQPQIHKNATNIRNWHLKSNSSDK